MEAKERYNKGLITLAELAESNPAAALSALEREHKRQTAILQEAVKAMQCQLDALTDAMYDKNIISYAPASPGRGGTDA